MKKDWKSERLGDVIEKLETTNPRANPQGEFNYIDVSSVSNTAYCIESPQIILGKNAPSRARRLVRKGDVLFATIRPTLKRIAIVPDYLDKQVCSTGFFVLRPNGKITSRFIFYYLFTEEFQKNMQSLQKGASYPAVTNQEVIEQAISYPPLPEQQRIVAILDEAFEGIEAASKTYTEKENRLNSFKQSLLNQAFSGHLGGTGNEGWTIKKLGEVCKIIGGGTPSKSTQSFYSGDIPWATVRDMHYDWIKGTEFSITKEAVRASSTNVIPSGNVVIATRVGLGKVCMLFQDTAINQDLKGILPNDPAVLYPRFIFWWFKSISKIIESEGTGATVKGVKLTFIGSLGIPLPPLPEQRRIVAILDEAFEAVVEVSKSCQHNRGNLTDLKQSILHQAFTGQL